MRHLVVLFVHFIATLARLLGPGGVRSLVAESLILKHQLLIVKRSRQRSPNLCTSDRILRLDGALGTSHPSAPFRNRSEAFDAAWPSQSLEQAKVPRAVLLESPSEARPERTERRTRSCGRRNEATKSQLGLSANRSTDRPGVPHPNGQRHGAKDSRPSLPAGTELRRSLLADAPGPHERQPLEHGSVPVRIGIVGGPTGFWWSWINTRAGSLASASMPARSMVSHFVACSTAPFEGNAGCRTSSAPISIPCIGSTNGKPTSGYWT